MRALSTKKKIENCLLALANWHKVKPHTVDLFNWRCGTQACFGGHLATWPEFQAQGVKPDESGTPTIGLEVNGSCTFDGQEVAGHLFGDETLFSPRGYSSYDRVSENGNGHVSHHQIVVRRLEGQIVNLSTPSER